MRHLSNSRAAAATKRKRRFYLAKHFKFTILFFFYVFCLFLVFLFEMQFPHRPSIPWHEDVSLFFLSPLLCDVYPQFFFSLDTRSPQPTFWLWLWTKKAKHVKNWCPFTCRLTIPRKVKYRTPSVVVANPKKKKGCTWKVPPFLFDSFILSL